MAVNIGDSARIPDVRFRPEADLQTTSSANDHLPKKGTRPYGKAAPFYDFFGDGAGWLRHKIP
jgi:hypothetical protein